MSDCDTKPVKEELWITARFYLATFLVKRLFAVSLLFVVNICWGQEYYWDCTGYVREDWKLVMDYEDVTASLYQRTIDEIKQTILHFNSKPKAGDLYIVCFWGSIISRIYVVELLPNSRISVYEIHEKKRRAEW